MIINTTHIRHIHKLVAVSSRPIFRLSTRLPPRISSKDIILKTRRKFSGREDLEYGKEGKGCWKDTLWEGEEEFFYEFS
jgi:hypothetical protein